MAKQKRVLLINLSTMSVYSKPVVKVGVPLMPPLTLAVLAAPLMKKGFSVDVFDFNLTNLKKLEVFKKKLESFDPTHVAISVMTPSYNQLKEVASFIKDYNKNIVITAGGPHISVYPKQTLKETVIDINVRGEDDFILPKIIRGQNLKKLNSVYYKKNKKIVRGRVNVSSYFLSGLIKCGNCGSNFQGHQKVIKGKKYRYYVCGGYQSKGDFVCSQHYINAGIVEKYVLEQIKEEFFKHVSKEQLMRDIKQELGTKFKDSTEELRQVENALKENSRKVELLLDAIDARHRDIVNERLDRLKAERQLLEEKREHLTGRGGDIDIEKTASEILQYTEDVDKAFAKGIPQEKKIFVRQLVADVTIYANKSEGILGLYSFPVMGHFGHAEGGT